MIYEITLLMPNDDWKYWRMEFPDFHTAAKEALDSTTFYPGSRLLRIETIPSPISKLKESSNANKD